MSRFPPTPTSELPEETRPYGEKLDSLIERIFGENGSIITYEDDRGALLGPFPIIAASREAGDKIMSVFASLESLGDFPADAKEVVILTVGARFQCDFERYAHKRLGVKKAGLTQQQVDQLAVGQKPEGLSGPANVAYDASYYLANTPGPMPQELFDACEKTFGRNGTLALMHYTGMYAYMCVLMNAAAAPLPKGEVM